MKVIFGVFIVSFALFCNYWANTQPVWISENKSLYENDLLQLPEKNKQVIDFIEANGFNLAPTYESVVCTEFVIKVIDQFETLSPREKNSIRIVTSKNLDSLIQTESQIIRGVQTALTLEKKGFSIEQFEDVKPGDFVQFWNRYNGNEYGHCGIVLEINPNRSLTVYSSHPLTNGYGKQKFLWPDRVYFARLK